MNKIEKLFSSTKLMMICGILGAIICLVRHVPYAFLPDYPEFRFDFLAEIALPLLIVSLLFAFKKGETNIQKTLIGSLLFFFVSMNFPYGIYYLEDYFLGGYDASFLYYGIIYTIIGVMEVGILVSHCLLQSDHIGSNKLVIINRIMCVIVIAVYTFDIFHSFMFEDMYLNNEYMLDSISEILLIVMVICIETKIQMYKKIRTQAIKNDNWTLEEKMKAKELFK